MTRTRIHAIYLGQRYLNLDTDSKLEMSNVNMDSP